jgi:hypothetical protein
VKVKVYVEGGGDSKELQARCREGFRKLVERAGFTKPMPAFVACGGRASAYDRFKTAAGLGGSATYPVLLVDSEYPVEPPPGEEVQPESPTAWEHLKRRDHWERPAGVENDQAQLMVTSMETWIMADRKALSRYFGHCLRSNGLLPESALETRPRQAVLASLENATRDCGKGRAYRKGKPSFQLLAQLDPSTLTRHLPYFRRFVETLGMHLQGSDA